MIDCRRLKKSFDRQVVLDGVDLRVPEGGITVVIGGSGQGKSVLLKHLVGLIRPDSGSITIAGQDLLAAPPQELSRIKDMFGFVFQGGALFDSLTVAENVGFPLKYKTSLAAEKIEGRVAEMLRQLDLAGFGDRRPDQISGGMARRVALARALITRPAIILFDEPLAGLDPVTKNSVIDLIARTHERYGFTGVIVSHNIPDIFTLADQVAMLADGRIIAAGQPEAVMNSREPRVRHFLSGGREGL